MASYGRLSSFSLHRPDEAKSFGETQPMSTPRSAEHSDAADTEDAASTVSLEEEYQEDGHDMRVSVDEQSTSDGLDDEHGLPKHWFSWRKLWLFTGPGFLMSIAYLDPGNLESDLQAGAQAGYSLSWVLLWSTALGYIFQMLACKLGVATGRHLAQHCRREYPPAPRYALWIMTEIAIIGSDIQEVIGSAIAILLLSRGYIPLYAGVLITAVDSFLLLLIERLGIRNLEALFGVLIAVMALSFGFMAELAQVSLPSIAKGLVVPSVTASTLQPAVAIMGAVIMPHNIYLHSSLTLSRKLDRRSVSKRKEAMAYYSIESGAALLISLVINVCVVAVFAKGFHNPAHRGQAVGLENAGQYLGEAFGSQMKYVWAIGLLAAGQSSTMTGTYSGQFVMGGFLNLHIAQWQRVAITRSVAIAPTFLVALLYAGKADNTLDVMTEWLNVLQSIQLPFALIPVLALTNDSRIMGAAFVNGSFQRVCCWLGASVVLCVNAVLVAGALKAVPRTALYLLPLSIIITVYLSFVAYLIMGPSRSASLWNRIAYGEPGGERLGDRGDADAPLLNGSRSSHAQAT